MKGTLWMEQLQPNIMRSSLSRYGLAVLATLAALVIKLLLMPLTGTESPFLLFFATVMVSAAYGGIQAGLLATLLSAGISDFFFLSPDHSFLNQNVGENIRLFIFILEAGSISFIISRLTTANQKVQQGKTALHNAYAELERRVEERTVELLEVNQALQQQIAEHERTQAKLHDKEQRFRAIFNQTFQFIGLMQPDGVLIEANQTALDFGGLQLADVVNRPFWETHWWTISPATQAQLEAAVEKAATGKFIRYEVDVLGQNNIVITIDFSIKPIYDEAGQVVLLLPEGRDVTQLKQAEQTLRSFFDSASIMMGIVELVGDEDIFHIADNAASAQFFGSTPQQMQHRLASEMGASKSHIQQWIHYYREAERTGAPVRFEYAHTTSNGEHWLSVTVCGIPIKAGRAPRFSYIVENVTDRKHIEAQMRQLNAELELRVQERTAQLESTNQQLANEALERECALQELHQIDAALRQSEENFRLVAESMPQIVWTARPDGSVDYYNQRWVEFTGVPCGAGQNWGWMPVLHPEDEQRTVDTWTQAVQTGQIYECEHRTRRSDGEFRWFLSRGLPLRNEQGQIIKWFGTATDIHATKQAEEALRLSAERFRIALQNTPIVVFNQDRELRYTWIHNSQLGYSAEDLLGKTDIETLPKQGAEQITALKQQVITSEQGCREEVEINTEKGVRYYDITIEPLRDQNQDVVGITAAAVDITDRKRTELELQTRARQQAAIARLGQQALSIDSVDQFMTEAIQVIVDTLGVEYCKVLERNSNHSGMCLRWGVGWQKDWLGKAIIDTESDSHAGYTLATQKPVIVTDLRQETRFKASPLLQEHSVISGISVQIAGQNQPFGILGIHTRQQHLFSQDDVYFLQAAANIMAETIQRQQARETLQRQSAELALANRLKDEFLATISHELRTPLNSMVGWTRLLPTRKFDAETTERAIEIIARNTQSLAQVVEDVLDMSDIITGSLKLQVAPVDLTEVLEQAIETIHVAAEAKNIQIKFHSDAATVIVMGDAIRLRQVLWNLLSNAVKFTPNGGKVDLWLNYQQNQAQIQIRDSGKGISLAFLPHVFDRFRQEDGSTTRLYGGLGLGLAIVRYLVEQHGGSVHADSPGEGQGATFTIELPLALV